MINLPVGGVDPRELTCELAKALTRPPKLVPEPLLFEYNFERFVWFCCIRKFSSLAGDGTKPTSQSMSTRLPIHQSLLYLFADKKHTFKYTDKFT